MSRARWISAVAAAGSLLTWSGVQAGETLGFAVTWISPSLYYDAAGNDCAGGPNETLDWRDILARKGLSADRIKQLTDNPNGPDFLREIIHRGRNGENVCARPETDYLSPEWKTVTGKISYGVNLDGTTDGAATARTCQHEKFFGADGAAAVDNQLYRVMGCFKAFRGEQKKAFLPAYINERMREGMITYLVELSGIDDRRNDPEITIAIYLGTDPLQQDASAGVMSDSTQRISSDRRYHKIVRGQIKDGVITSETFDMDLLSNALWLPEYHFKDARLRLTLNEDRSLSGMLAAYQDWESVFWGRVKSGTTTETYSANNCPGLYRAFKRMADGGKDPVTGECSMISSAYTVEAVPAFLVHPADEKTAEAAPPRTTQAAAR